MMFKKHEGVSVTFGNSQELGGICTCFIGYVAHVGGIMLDRCFVMFQRAFKISGLVRRISKFFFLQGLQRHVRMDTALNGGSSRKTPNK